MKAKQSFNEFLTSKAVIDGELAQARETLKQANTILSADLVVEFDPVVVVSAKMVGELRDDVSKLANIANLKVKTSLSDDETKLVKSYIGSDTKAVTTNVKQLIKSTLSVYSRAFKARDKLQSEASEAKAQALAVVARKENELALARKKLLEGVASDYKLLLLGCAEGFTPEGDNVTGRHLAEAKIVVSWMLGESQAPVVERDGKQLKAHDSAFALFDSLEALASVTIGQNDGLVSTLADEVNEFGLPYLSEFVKSLGTNVTRTNPSDTSLGEESGHTIPKPAVKTAWQTCAAKRTVEPTVYIDVREKLRARLWAMVAKCREYKQKSILAGVRQWLRYSEGRAATHPLDSLRDVMHLVQGGINAAVEQAVVTRGQDLTLLNKLNTFSIVYTPYVGFALSEYRQYIEDCLPHVVWKPAKNGERVGKWELRSQKQLANRKLGSFGIYLFGEFPILPDDNERAPVFPVLCLEKWRQIRKIAATEAKELNAAEKLREKEDWAAYEASFPLTKQIETLDSELSKVEAQLDALKAKKQALQHASK